ncbi:MAG TPA: hypothetical protein VFI47_31330 [Acidimicrobiales bacterium]|nr:hypothetical protein [Acidimicrobiales bacterium]
MAAAVANLPDSNQGTAAPAGAYPVGRDLAGDVAAADLPARVEVQCAEGVFDTYCEAVMAELQDHGVGFVSDDDLTLRQLGEARRRRGRLDRVIVVTGDMAVLTPDGARVVSRREGLTADEQMELHQLREDLKGAVTAGDVALSSDGERAARRGVLPSVTATTGGWRIDPMVVVGVRRSTLGMHRRDLVAMAHEGLLAVEPRWDAPLARYVELQDRWDERTVAVFLDPAGG